jgi:hypothetical protein
MKLIISADANGAILVSSVMVDLSVLIVEQLVSGSPEAIANDHPRTCG